ncbi:MAG TPA: hypothetical protein VHB70_04760 [Parafilimonas sp.]|nr:hypothetical protein [Parafilimonas sp.]
MSRAAFLNFLYKLIFYIEAGWLLIDMVGGYFLNESNGSSLFNTLIRAAVLVIIFTVFLLDKNIKGRAVPFFLTIIFLTLGAAQYIVFKFQTIDFDIIFKLILFPIFLILFRSQIEQGRITQKNLYTILYVNIFIMALNISLSYVNIGFSNYGVNKTGDFVGGTGFFYAGNEVGGVLTVLSGVGLYFFSKKGFWVTYGFAFLFLVCSLGLLSKTALISVFLNVTIVVMLSSFYRRLVILVLIIVGAIVFQSSIVQQITLFWTRLSYFAHQQGWETILTGGLKRETAVGILEEIFIHNPVSIFIGHVWTGYTENNFLDVLEGFGVLGYLFFIIPLIFFVDSLKKVNIKKDRKQLLLIFNCLLIFGVAVFAGHIIQSGMNSLFLAILLNFGNFKKLSTS